jgi:ribA/ribD-fused uncharacterized protein
VRSLRTQNGHQTFQQQNQEIYEREEVSAMINQFRGEYDFLSNFWPGGIGTNEHYFQAHKTLDPKLRALILSQPTPGRAKKVGRSVPLRPDWEQVKEKVMEKGLRIKFQRAELRYKLIATWPHELIEGNYWGDEIWGVNLKNGKGQNLLGKLLMKIRQELIDNNGRLPIPKWRL